MSILESIKGDRKLSFNHWRFRILHWAYDVKNPDMRNPGESGLPMFLYTHYCPLFHLTNLIAILSPFILLIRFCVVLVKIMIVVVSVIPFGKLNDWMRKKAMEGTVIRGPERIEKSSEQLRKADIKKCIKYIKLNYEMDVNEFYNYIGGGLSLLTQSEIKDLFNTYAPKFKEAHEIAVIRKKKWKERIIFWTNFSRVFIKWAMNIAYIGLAIFLMYAVYWLSIPVWEFICWVCSGFIWLWSDGGLIATLWTILKVTLVLITIGLGIAVIATTSIAEKTSKVIGSSLEYISPPFYILAVPFKWIGNGFVSLYEFVSMFYEENCPPIKLVSEEEAIVESVANNGEEV